MPTNGISLVTSAMTFLAGLKQTLGRKRDDNNCQNLLEGNILRVDDDPVTLI